MIIRNGMVFQENKNFVQRDVYIENGRIVHSIQDVEDTTEVDAGGLYVLPGLVDIHSHGAVGHDFSDGDEEGLKEILKYEYSHGITTYCPTSMTVDKEKLTKIFSSMADWKDEKGMSHVAGINMEGPFLDVNKRGAHRPEWILDPDIDLFRECNRLCGGKIRLATLAPNIDGAMEFIQALKEETVISLGHTAADYDTCKKALDAGACHVTHLYNAMNPLEHRAPGLIAAASEDENCVAELICDGIHVHASMIKVAFKLFPDRIALISDSMRAVGLANGTYELGGQQVHVDGRRATLSNGTIAGSATNVYDCMCTAVSFGIPLEDAIAAATITPAKSIGIFDEVGSLTPGKRADVLLVDKNLKLVRVI